MIDKEVFKQIINYVLVVGLFIIAFLVIRPIIFSMIYGILLAYLFYPVYRWTKSKLKNETLSALLVCIGILLIVVVIVVVIFWSLLNQGIDFYLTLQKLNIGELIAKALPEFVVTSGLSSTIIGSINSSFSQLIAGFVTTLSKVIFNLPDITVQFFVLAFMFFFGLRDGEAAFEYFRSLSPVKKETQNKFFKHFEDITKSVLIGQVVIGIIQGLVAGVGYFIFGVPNALLLTVLTVVIGILPIIGPWLVWIPVDVYLFVIGRDGAGLGLLIYGLFLINWVEVILRPIIVSRRAQINEVVVFIGMMGGIYFFGVIGLIIGPLILAYVLLVLELYQKHNLSEDNIIFQKPEA
ncbi:MAG: AI-2E family transporter [Nanoarchaeota archaeon]